MFNMQYSIYIHLQSRSIFQLAMLVHRSVPLNNWAVSWCIKGLVPRSSPTWTDTYDHLRPVTRYYCFDSDLLGQMIIFHQPRCSWNKGISLRYLVGQDLYDSDSKSTWSLSYLLAFQNCSEVFSLGFQPPHPHFNRFQNIPTTKFL